MAFQTGTRVDPRLGALDFSGFTNAANIQAKALSNLGATVGEAITDYKEKKEQKITDDRADKFLVTASEGNTSLGQALRSLDITDKESARVARKSLGKRFYPTLDMLMKNNMGSTSDIQNYNFLRSKEVDEKVALEQAFGGGSTNINVDTGQAGDVASRNVLARDQQFYVDTIEPALSSVPNIKYMEKMLNVVGDDGKVITGKLANQELFLKSLAQDIGMGEFPDVASTEAYLGTSGRLVGSVIRLFGAGTGLSDADREFAKKIAAGDITMDKEALKRLISLAKSGINNQINLFNNRIERTYQPEIVGEGVSRLGKGRLFTPNVDSLFSSENNIMQSLVTPGASGDGAGNDLMDKAQSILDNIQ